MSVFIVLADTDYAVIVKCKTSSEALAIAKHKYYEVWGNRDNPNFEVHYLDTYLGKYCTMELA